MGLCRDPDLVAPPERSDLSVTVLAALQQAVEGFRATSNVYGVGLVHTMRMIVAGNQGDFSTSFEEARLALELLPPHDHQWRHRALAGAALSSLYHGICGPPTSRPRKR